jgi:hypothetical protein
MDSRLAAAKSGGDRLSRQISYLDDRLALREKALRTQFTSLETALQTNQAQGHRLRGQLAALHRSQLPGDDSRVDAATRRPVLQNDAPTCLGAQREATTGR